MDRRAGTLLLVVGMNWTWTDFFVGIGVGGAIGAVVMALIAGSC